VTPQPPAVGDAFRSRLMAQLSVSSIDELRKLPVADIIAAQAALNVHTLFPIATGPFWSECKWTGEVLIGDCEQEWSLFKTSIATVDDPTSLFPDLPASKTILEAYGKGHDGVLKFVGDAKFHYHTERYYRDFLAANPNVYRYIFDAPNPFAPEVGAHHAVDVLYLFGCTPMSLPQESLGEEMRKTWSRFVAGVGPWDKGTNEKVLLFVEEGCRLVDGEEVAKRRNVEQWKVLEKLGWDAVAPVVGEIVRGRIKFE
jgi:carboxylesterase type B